MPSAVTPWTRSVEVPCRGLFDTHGRSKEVSRKQLGKGLRIVHVLSKSGSLTETSWALGELPSEQPFCRLSILFIKLLVLNSQGGTMPSKRLERNSMIYLLQICIRFNSRSFAYCLLIPPCSGDLGS